MNVKAIFLFSAFLIFSGFFPLRGQSVTDSLYNELESVRLVVRLPSQEKKRNALQAKIADPGLTDQTRDYLSQQLEKVERETESQNKTIVAAFEAYFQALPVFFVYDTTHNPVEAIFLDSQLKAKEQAAVSSPLIQLRFGRPLADTGNRPESMVLTDSRLQDLDRPFPKPLIMTGIGYGINKLLAPDIAFRKLMEKRVKKLNRQLEELRR